MRIKTNSSHIENTQRNSPSKKIERTNFTVHQNILRKMVQNDKFLRRKCRLRIYSDRSASLSKWAISEIEGTCCHNRRPNQKKPFLVYLWSHKKLIERWTSIYWRAKSSYCSICKDDFDDYLYLFSGVFCILKREITKISSNKTSLMISFKNSPMTYKGNKDRKRWGLN